MKVLCIGHATYDVVIPVSSYPIENTKNRVGSEICCGGGPAANCAYLLGKWGIDTYFCGLVGNDVEGNIIENEFKSVNVNTDYLVKDDNFKTTKSYLIVNTENASRTSLACQSNKKVIENLNIDIKPDIILIDGHEFELSKKIINDNKDAIVVIDAGRYDSNVVELCHMSDYIVCSKNFAQEYTNSKDIDYMLTKMNEDFNGKVVITLEEDGCAYYDDAVKIIKPVLFDAVDTTGAGDIFHGAFIYGLINKWDMYKILSFANTTSSLSITKLTGRKSICKLDTVRKLYDELRRRNFY